MTEASISDLQRPDPRTFTGFIARALEMGGPKAALREAERLLAGYDEREIRRAAEEMPSKVRTAVLKMLTLRQSP